MNTHILKNGFSARLYASFAVLVIAALVLSACAAPAAPATQALPQTGGQSDSAAAGQPVREPTAVPTAEPTQEPQSIVEIAAADGRFATLVKAVETAGLAETLSGPGAFTVFAPTDEAFAKLPAGTIEGLLKDPEALKEILLYHVVDGKVMAADVAGLSEAQSLLGKPLAVRTDMGKVKINDAEVVITDIQASNGVIHVIDSVLLPQETTIVDAAVADGRFKTLASALAAAGLVETLKGEGPFTVFAPTDEAFAKLPAGTLDNLLKTENMDQLKNILLYHVVDGEVLAADVAKLDTAKTLSGQEVKIQAEGDQVKINDAQVVIADIQTDNGVIHVIDAVLLPQQETMEGEQKDTADKDTADKDIADKNIVDTAIADGRFTTLVTAVQAAGLVDALKAEGPFTVFAPTDEAFAKLPAGTVETLLKTENLEQLKNILLYHVVEGEVLAEDVVKLESADTLLGQPLTIEVKDGKVYINGVQVIITDILTSNGVIHVIDAVLLPEE